MRLNTWEQGTGDRLAVLVHGVAAGSGTWRRLAADLTGRGYRVVAVDLPGHGGSPPWPDVTPTTAADALVAAVPVPPELAMGHSLGGTLLALAAGRLLADRTVYVETPFRPPAVGLSPAELTSGLAERVRPETSWDPSTAAALVTAFGGRDVTPTARNALVLAGGSSPVVPAAEADRLRRAGFGVRAVPEAGHNLHETSFAAFLAALQGWL